MNFTNMLTVKVASKSDLLKRRKVQSPQQTLRGVKSQALLVVFYLYQY